MQDHLFLHDGEILLASHHSSPAVLITSLLRGLLESLAATVLLSGAAFAITFFGMDLVLPWYLVLVVFVLSLLTLWILRFKTWRHATFRITTERILVAHPGTLFHPPVRTVKWAQYQESAVGHRTVLDFFFGARPLIIRFGTADAANELHFPSLTYAQDLKHYLDKVDSAVRKGEIATVRPFVAKPRGRRDI